MTNLKAYVVPDSNDNIRVANMTELEVIEALKDEVSKLKAQIGELNKAETEA
jgi:hypothetical protein